MSKYLTDITFKLAQYSVFLPFLLSLIRWRSLSGLKKLLFVLLCSGVLVTFFTVYLWRTGSNNLFLLHFYTPVECIIWLLMYAQLFESRKMKRFIRATIYFFLLFSVLNTIYWQPLETFNANSRSLESAILVVFSLLYYFKLFKEKKVDRLELYDSFWLNGAVLIYFSGSFLLFGFSNLLLQSDTYRIKEVWIVHAFFVLVYYAMISIGIWTKSTLEISR